MTWNIIADNFLSKIGKEGHRKLLIDEATYHRRYDKAMQTEGIFVTT